MPAALMFNLCVAACVSYIYNELAGELSLDPFNPISIDLVLLVNTMSARLAAVVLTRVRLSVEASDEIEREDRVPSDVMFG